MDIETMICCVEKYPCLWDVDHEHYRNKTIRDEAWHVICAIVYPDWEELSKEMKFEKYLDLKRRWNNTRDYYRKDILSKGETSRRRYIYAERLKFLQKSFRGKVATKIPEIPWPENTEQDDFMQSEQEIEYLEMPEDNPIANLTPPRKKSKKSPKRNYEESEEKKDQDNEDDERFLLSFRSDMKRMGHAQKLTFKCQMMELLKRNFDEYGEQSTSFRCKTEKTYVDDEDDDC